jgi:hypothetical protein
MAPMSRTCQSFESQGKYSDLEALNYGQGDEDADGAERWEIGIGSKAG